MGLSQPGLDSRHRDKDGEISKKHGNNPYQYATRDLRAELRPRRGRGRRQAGRLPNSAVRLASP
jgi:hypothetical protein